MSAVLGVGPVLVVDMGALAFTRSKDGSVLTVAVGSRLLGVVKTSAGDTDQQAMFQALEQITEESWVDVDSPYGPGQVKARVAWLNPFTSCISQGSATTGRVFTDHAPLPLDEECVVGQVKFDATHGRVLSIAGRSLAERAEPSLREVTRELVSHS